MFISDCFSPIKISVFVNFSCKMVNICSQVALKRKLIFEFVSQNKLNEVNEQLSVRLNKKT